jgi:hypothetical protein
MIEWQKCFLIGKLSLATLGIGCSNIFGDDEHYDKILYDDGAYMILMVPCMLYILYTLMIWNYK